MGLRINTNIEAFNAHRNLSVTRASSSPSRWRSSRRASASTAPATTQQASASPSACAARSAASRRRQRNAQDGISLVQTAEGAMQELHSILHRVRELAVQYKNGVNGAAAAGGDHRRGRAALAEITRMIGAANFNGIALLTGARHRSCDAAGRPEPAASDQLAISAVDVADARSATRSANFQSGATDRPTILDDLDAAIDALSTARAAFGAVQNRLEHTVNALGIYQENLMAAESRIRDVDMAQEMTNFTKLQILQQSGTAMLAQANHVQPERASASSRADPPRADGTGSSLHRTDRSRPPQVRSGRDLRVPATASRRGVRIDHRPARAPRRQRGQAARGEGAVGSDRPRTAVDRATIARSGRHPTAPAPGGPGSRWPRTPQRRRPSMGSR